MKTIESIDTGMVYSFLLSMFSFWFSAKVFEGLWPGAEIRPLALPLIWLFLALISLSLCGKAISSDLKSKSLMYALLKVIFGALPILFGYLGLIFQIQHIGLKLAE